MSQIGAYLTEDRRLVILRLLEQSGDYRANEYLLRTALESMGHSVGPPNAAGASTFNPSGLGAVSNQNPRWS